ncbi:kinase-like domain-containing protein [Rhizophagus clarus]|uniref:Kinase-like domain-containing protein n=1 Tax=Rhizophagus clarus TaxID=94130 RepID=A0A8H3LWB2_9GLOM|nr:kinase-like domain-containing protein [Rhizophagus clarus]
MGAYRSVIKNLFVYRTKWIDGYIEGWDNVNQNWKRCKPNEFVALKSLNDSENVIFEFINDILSYHKTNYAGNTIIRVYGITQDQETKDYLIVMKYAAHGNTNSINRPIAEEIHDVLFQWWYLFDGQTELQRQIKVVEEINKNLQTRSAHTTNLSYETHSEAIYTSRLLYFDNLLEPKNSDDYYDEQNDDNIISVKFSDSLQIDII